jgi:hypothetical protein
VLVPQRTSPTAHCLEEQVSFVEAEVLQMASTDSHYGQQPSTAGSGPSGDDDTDTDDDYESVFFSYFQRRINRI